MTGATSSRDSRIGRRYLEPPSPVTRVLASPTIQKRFWYQIVRLLAQAFRRTQVVIERWFWTRVVFSGSIQRPPSRPAAFSSIGSSTRKRSEPSGRWYRRPSMSLSAALEPDRRGQPGEEEPSPRERSPHPVEHAVEVRLVVGEVEHGAADDRVEALGREGDLGQVGDLEARRGEVRGELRREPADLGDRFRVSRPRRRPGTRCAGSRPGSGRRRSPRRGDSCRARDGPSSPGRAGRCRSPPSAPAGSCRRIGRADGPPAA